MSRLSEEGRPRLERRGHRPIRISQDEILCFACVRNEELRLPYFLDYHRNLGVNSFFMIDNGSEDGTLEYLLSQPDVYCFFTRDSYGANRCGVVWLNELLARYGSAHWTLTLDADELLVYPRCEQLGLRQLIQYLEQVQAQGLVAFLLDMYPDKPIKDALYQRGKPFQHFSPYFDWDTFHEKDTNGIPVRGGARHRLFWAGRGCTKPSPVLKKVPFVKWRYELAFEASTHVIRDLRLASVTGALLHFKFFSDFYAYAEREVSRKEHWDGAAQYESYWRVLRDNPNLCASYEGSLRYHNSAQLVELGLLQTPAEFERFAGQKLGQGSPTLRPHEYQQPVFRSR